MAPELPENLAEVFEYLDELRESGEANMFGAPPYVQSEFPRLSESMARACVKAWMGTFDGETSPEDRAAKALAA